MTPSCQASFTIQRANTAPHVINSSAPSPMRERPAIERLRRVQGRLYSQPLPAVIRVRRLCGRTQVGNGHAAGIRCPRFVAGKRPYRFRRPKVAGRHRVLGACWRHMTYGIRRSALRPEETFTLVDQRHDAARATMMAEETEHRRARHLQALRLNITKFWRWPHLDLLVLPPHAPPHGEKRADQREGEATGSCMSLRQPGR